MSLTFQEIEKRRQASEISQSELCRVADVHATTYHKLLKNPSVTPQRRTLAKLTKALTALLEEVTS